MRSRSFAGRATCRLRRGRHEGVGFLWGDAVAVCFEGCCGSGRLKVARGRSWQPEIGMEHASRGRRSGNKGVGARWRGRFRIFSARHCSRTKVSHAENSGMTMLFFLWRLLRCRREWEREHEGGLIRCAGRPQEWSFGAVPPQERWHEGGWFLFFLWRLLRCRRGILSHARERTARGEFGFCGREELDFLRRMRQFWGNGAIIWLCFRKPLRMHSHVCRRDSHL